MSQTSLPTETWQTILRYAISVPVFFDTDPVEASSIEATIGYYNDSGPYYEAERTRNILRRVCSSWNGYLMAFFSDRYVQFSDLFHGHVRLESISAAIRLSMSECVCGPCRRDANWEDGKPRNIMKKLLEQKFKQWAVEIIDGRDLDWSYLEKLQPRLHKIRSLVVLEESDSRHTSRPFPNLTFMAAFYNMDHMSALSLSRLTTLSINIVSLNVCATWILPSLKYFSFFSDVVDPDQYVKMLESIGKNLLILYDISYPSRKILPDQIWTLCPKLQCLQTSFIWPVDPPVRRPLKSIQVNPQILANLGHLKEERLPLLALKTMGVTRVGMRNLWLSIVEQEGFLSYITFGLDHGLSLCDVEGTLFQDFVVMLIRVYWKGEKAYACRLRNRSNHFLWF